MVSPTWDVRNTSSPLNVCESDMTVGILEMADPIEPNDVASYTVTATNNGFATALNVDIVIDLSGSAYPGAISNLTEGAGPYCSFTNPTITCTDIPTVLVGGSYGVQFDVTPTVEGTIVIDAEVFADAPETGGNNTASETTTVSQPSADVTVQIGSSPSPVYSHQSLTVTFDVANGPLQDATNVALTAIFSGTGFDELLSTPTAGCVVFSAVQLDCDLGTIVTSGSTQAEVVVELSGAVGTVDVAATVSADAPEIGGNNTDNESIDILEGCNIAATLIGTLPDVISPTISDVTVQGVVTSDFLNIAANGSTSQAGFYIQDAGDGDPNTSDGIFVSATTPVVTEGMVVRVTGTAGENFSQSRIVPTEVLDCGTTSSVAPTAVTLPVTAQSDWEKYEGMLVTVSDSTSPVLTVNEAFQLHFRGQYEVASGGRLYTPTSIVEPGIGATGLAAEYLLRRLMIDDGRDGNVVPNCTVPNMECPAPVAHFRMGSTTPSLTGVLGFGFSVYRLHTTVAPVYTNQRPTEVPDPGGRLRVASFNVLNFFNGDGLEESSDPNSWLEDGPPTDISQRGAHTYAEYVRQLDKLLVALEGIDADVIGLMEIENDEGALSAIQALVDALNEHLGTPGQYAYIDTGKVGTDAIKVAIIYRTTTVTPSGGYAVLDDVVPFNTNTRPPVVQTFVENATGQDFTVVVNHFKSKSCSGATGADTDQGDGQSCYNATRILAANELLAWLATDPTGTGDDDILIIGDLNSYAKEDPIDVFIAAGYTNLVHLYGGDAAYGYVFGAGSGYLDHALANPSALPQVTGTVEWHINADEPVGRDYNDDTQTSISGFPNRGTDFTQPPELYEVNEFRTSDHDPVLIGLSLSGATGTVSVPASILPGEDAYTVTVVDADLSGATIDVTLTSAAGENETLTLTATGSPGEYSATFDTAIDAPTAGNDVIEAVSGDELTVTYIDVVNADGDTDTDVIGTTLVEETSVPGGFELTGPIDGAIERAGEVTLAWTEAEDDNVYVVLLTKISGNTRIGPVFEVTVEANDVCAGGACSIETADYVLLLGQGAYAWTVTATGDPAVEASNAPFTFTVVLEAIELVSNGGFENGLTDWTKVGPAKALCGALGAGSDCALRLKVGGSVKQSGVMAEILSYVDSAAGDVLSVSADIWSKQDTLNKALIVKVNYASSTAGVNANGKDKFKLAATGVTETYAEYSDQYELADAIIGGTVKVQYRPLAGKAWFDNVSVKLMPLGTTIRGEFGVLPPPAAPPSFRGSN